MKINFPLVLMQGLYYPAALGTGLVLFLLRFSSTDLESAVTDVRNWFALLLLFYFSLSYVSIQRWSEAYDWRLFLLDLMEMGAALFAFKYLGFVDSSVPWHGFRGFYVCAAIVPALHFLWNLHIGVRRFKWRLRALNLSRFLILAVGALFLARSLRYAWFALGTLASLTVWYVFFMYGGTGGEDAA